jgi:hypothetical protein
LKYLIWSIEHRAWWCADRRGYTHELPLAGRYAFDEAEAIVEDANIAIVNECLIPESCVQENHQ